MATIIRAALAAGLLIAAPALAGRAEAQARVSFAPRICNVTAYGARGTRVFEEIGLYNSPSFHLVVKESEKVTVTGMRFVALAHSPNTDAIDPVDTRDMLIAGNLFDVGDDIVAIKSSRVDPAHPDASVENIVVRGNRGLAGRGICIGSETVGGVRNVLVEDNVL